MCVPGCLDSVHARLSRRSFFKGAGAAAATGTAAMLAPSAPASAAQRSFSRVVDMTHTLDPTFPTYFQQSGIELERMASLGEDGFNMYRWHVIEHAGTHLDAPIHFSEDGPTADVLAINELVAPLVVVDIKARAAEDPDAQVTPEDITAWESVHGPIPQGAAVAMNSGWDRRIGGPDFAGLDSEGSFHFPGFHVETAQYLMTETGARGLVVDTLSLDYGPSASFDTHYAWLPSNRWGMENIKNLDQVPPSGATLVVGTPRIRGATGGPSRAIALV